MGVWGVMDVSEDFPEDEVDAGIVDEDDDEDAPDDEESLCGAFPCADSRQAKRGEGRVGGVAADISKWGSWVK